MSQANTADNLLRELLGPQWDRALVYNSVGVGNDTLYTCARYVEKNQMPQNAEDIG